jgi:hypothetical protein
MLDAIEPNVLPVPREITASVPVPGFPPSATLVPVENAAMPDHTIIQWDKNDLDSLGLLKVDCLALGMLSAIRRALELKGGIRRSRISHAGLSGRRSRHLRQSRTEYMAGTRAASSQRGRSLRGAGIGRSGLLTACVATTGKSESEEWRSFSAARGLHIPDRAHRLFRKVSFSYCLRRPLILSAIPTIH